MNFQEATEIAKSIHGSIISRDEFGEFYVRGQDGRPIGSSQGESSSFAQVLKEKEVRISLLEGEISALRMNIDAEIASKLKQRLDSIEAEWAHVQQVKSQLQEKCDQTEAEYLKLKLLEHAYAERFGAAEVKTISELVKSRDICSRCGGDGGVNGGCGKCDGTGWIISQIETVRDEVRFK